MSQIMEKTLAFLPKILTHSLIGGKTAKPTSRQAPSQDVQGFMKCVHQARSKSHEAAIVSAELSDMQQRLKQADLTASSWVVKNSFTKAIFCHHLGYDVTFVAIYAVNLAQQGKGYDKRLGYLLSCLLLHPCHEMVMLMMATLLRDLKSSNMADNCISLMVAGELVGEENIPSILPEVIKKLNHSHELVREKALHCFRAFYQTAPALLQPSLPQLDKFLASRDPGILCATTSIFLLLVADNPVKYVGLGNSILHILHQINNRGFGTNYYYHMVPLPWLQINLLKILGQLGSVDSQLSEKIAPLLQTLIEKTKVTEPISLAVLVESISTASKIHANEQLLHLCSRCIGKLLSSDASNGMKCQGLGLLIALSKVKLSYAAHHQMAVIECLGDEDPVIQARTTYLLHAMANRGNAKAICVKLFEQAKKTNDKHFVNEIFYMISDVGERLISDIDLYINTYLNILQLDIDIEMRNTFIDLVLSRIEQTSREAHTVTEDSINNLMTTLFHVLSSTHSAPPVIMLSLQLFGVLAPVIGQHFPTALFLTTAERYFIDSELLQLAQKTNIIMKSPVQYCKEMENNSNEDWINVQCSCLQTILKLVVGSCMEMSCVKNWLEKLKLRQVVRNPSICYCLEELEDIVQYPEDLATRFTIMFHPESAGLDTSLSFLDPLVVHDLLHGKLPLRPNYLALGAASLITSDREIKDPDLGEKTSSPVSVLEMSKASSSSGDSLKLSKSFHGVKNKWREEEDGEQFLMVNANGDYETEVQEDRKKKEGMIKELFVGVDDVDNYKPFISSIGCAYKSMWNNNEEEVDDSHHLGSSLGLHPFGISRKAKNNQQLQWHDDSFENALSFGLDDNAESDFISNEAEKVESPLGYNIKASSPTQTRDLSNALLFSPSLYNSYSVPNQLNADTAAPGHRTLPSIYTESLAEFGAPTPTGTTSSSTMSMSTIDTLTDSDPEESNS